MFKARSNRGFRKMTCSKCGGENDRGTQRYCSKCHASEMRAYRERIRNEMNMLREYYKLHNG